MNPLPSKFCNIHVHKPFKRECGIQCSLCSVSLLSVKIWMEGTYDMPSKNAYFFATTEPNQMGFLLRCR